MTTARRDLFGRWINKVRGDRKAPSTASPATKEVIQEWLVREVAEQLHVPMSEVDPGVALLDYGLDSLQAAAMAGKLERFLGRRLSPALLWDYPTIHALTDHLTSIPVAGDDAHEPR